MLRKYIAPITVFIMTLGICGAGALMFGPWMQEQYKIDQCLDGEGKWDFVSHSCLPPSK